MIAFKYAAEFYLISDAGKDGDTAAGEPRSVIRKSQRRRRRGIGTNFEVSEKGTPTGVRGTVECRDERANTARECTQVFEATRKPHLCSEIPAHLLSRRDDLRRFEAGRIPLSPRLNGLREIGREPTTLHRDRRFFESYLDRCCSIRYLSRVPCCERPCAAARCAMLINIPKCSIS